MHEVAAEEYRILESVNYELVTFTPADWVSRRGSQVTGSLLSLLAPVPFGVLASVALCLASDYVQDRPLSLESSPSRIGSSAWFLSRGVWVSFLLSGEGKASLVRSASLDARPLALHHLSVFVTFSELVRLGPSFFSSFFFTV